MPIADGASCRFGDTLSSESTVFITTSDFEANGSDAHAETHVDVSSDGHTTFVMADRRGIRADTVINLMTVNIGLK